MTGMNSAFIVYEFARAVFTTKRIKHERNTTTRALPKRYAAD